MAINQRRRRSYQVENGKIAKAWLKLGEKTLDGKRSDQ